MREGEAKRIGVSVVTLDKAVTKARRHTETEDPGAANFLTDPAPWPEPVNGADLLDRLTPPPRHSMWRPCRGYSPAMNPKSN